MYDIIEMIVGEFMEKYSLNIESPIIGGYFSSEQIDLLSIIQCKSIDELNIFIANCDQINHVKGIFESISGLDLDTAKRKVFKSYRRNEKGRISYFKYYSNC